MKKKKQGFTLAEVLIALTIIGVVAALTIPTLVQKTNKQEYVSALQKTYSTLSQATNMIIAENGSPKADESGETWMADSDALYNTYKKYISNIKECPKKDGCFPGNYKRLDGNMTNNFNTYKINKLILADGTLVHFAYNLFDKTCSYNYSGYSDSCASISVDINGEKKPNAVGRDFFEFVLTEKGLYPSGCSEDEGECCAAGKSGWGCAAKVLREGKMDY